MKYTKAKGVFDILPIEPLENEKWKSSDKWQHLERVMRKLALDYGYKEIRTPIFEKTDLFKRSVGESSDIVTKEMYTFDDKGARSMTLRPEGTACVIRSYVENNLHLSAPITKYFYIGPMFRYERPQAGRYRQHHHFGAEAIGEGSPFQDVEMIDMLCELYRRLGLKNLTVMINSIGNSSSREKYRENLRAFLEPKRDQLSADSQNRFDVNVLRILDSKNANDQKLLEGAPTILDSLDKESSDHFEKVKQLLEKLEIKYEINEKLVRGLDYYNHTVFEVISGELGAQNTIGAGGRYDGLVSQVGGLDLPSIGFATGFERVLQTMEGQNVPFPTAESPFIYLAPLDEKATELTFPLLSKLRHLNIPAEGILKVAKVKKHLKAADELNAKYVVIVGESEMETDTASIKNMGTRENVDIPLTEIENYITKLWQSEQTTAEI